MWQSQYTSQGPEGKTHKYLKQSCIPEFYVGADYKNGGLLAGVGIELLSLKPRTESIVNTDKYKVDDRITTLSYEAHVKYTNKRENKNILRYVSPALGSTLSTDRNGSRESS